MAPDLYQYLRTIPDFPEPGVLFKDITPILADPTLLRDALAALVEPFVDTGITKVIGIESRGFILGAMLADELDAGFVPVRKQGKLPYKTHQVKYELEYGTDCIEMHIDALNPSDKVLIHDDVIATGGTAVAAYRLAEQSGAEVVGFAFLIEINALKGREALGAKQLMHSVLHV